ncbi:MAG: PD-(D/E)XK nuclease family protein [Candidatus Dormibacteraeota bacterium]|nr:PD-(D/E)XK nuclease family protein [Candidatus Dormibacteraeota bacterium]
MRTCQRLFAFRHIVASATASAELRRRAYQAKQLQELSNWQGHLVHDILAHEFISEIKAHRRPALSYLNGAVRRLAEQQVVFSREHRYREPGMTKAAAGRSYCALTLHQRGEDIGPAQISETLELVGGCFEFLLSQTEFMSRLLTGRDHHSEVSLRFSLGDAWVKGTPDLVFLDAAGEIWIIDWKISNSLTSDYSHQLRLYGLAIVESRRWPAADVRSIRLIEANLLQRRLIEHPFSNELLDQTEDFAYRGITELRELVDGGHFEDLRLEELDVANRPTTCRYCNFSDLCIESLLAEGRAKEAEVIQGTLL